MILGCGRWTEGVKITYLFTLEVFSLKATTPKKTFLPGPDLDNEILDFKPESDALMEWDYGRLRKGRR